MHLAKKLKNKGYRLTRPRTEVLKTLTDYPLSVQEISEVLDKKNIRLDKASIYRTLELLVNMGLVYSIDLGEGKKRYELVDETKHHHHLVCNSCGKIEDIIVEEKKLLTDINKQTQFKIDHHHLEFFGLCINCQ